MHKFPTAVTKPSALLHRLCEPQAGAPDPHAGTPGLLNVPVGVSRWLTRTERAAHFLPVWLRFCHPSCSGEPLVASHRLAPTSLRDKNLRIIWLGYQAPVRLTPTSLVGKNGATMDAFQEIVRLRREGRVDCPQEGGPPVKHETTLRHGTYRRVWCPISGRSALHAGSRFDLEFGICLRFGV